MNATRVCKRVPTVIALTVATICTVPLFAQENASDPTPTVAEVEVSDVIAEGPDSAAEGEGQQAGGAPAEGTGVSGSEAEGDSQAGAEDQGQRYALIVIGIAGDEEHRQKFQQTADVWREWLIQIAGVKSKNMTILCSDDEADAAGPATAENIGKVVAQVESDLDTGDALWVFLLGHGSQDQRHAWFHLPGTDLSAAEWAGLFSKIRASEQVFWLTHAASGGFIKPMSLPRRVLISAADADGEVNETRFPHVLAEVMKRQLDRDEHEADSESTPINLLDLFRTTTERVSQAFEAEQLVTTEHAQLDDNGDGVGTELADLATVSDVAMKDQNDSSPSPVDGMRAGRISLRQPVVTDAKKDFPASITPL